MLVEFFNFKDIPGYILVSTFKTVATMLNITGRKWSRGSGRCEEGDVPNFNCSYLLLAFTLGCKLTLVILFNAMIIYYIWDPVNFSYFFSRPLRPTNRFAIHGTRLLVPRQRAWVEWKEKLTKRARNSNFSDRNSGSKTG